MQRYDNDQILYSPSDMATFLGCHHASLLDMKALDEDMETTDDSPINQLLQSKGLEHEVACLRCLKDKGNTVVDIPKDLNLKDRAKLTLDALQSGADVIYQAVFFDTPWRGDADFLIRCDRPSRLGDFSYEVLDTKLARTVAPKHIMQLCVYSELLAKLQGLRPANMHLVLGNQEKRSFRVADFFYYYTRTRGRFENYVRNLTADSYPEPCSHCTFCKWRDGCKMRWEEDDHLSLVANIRRSQMNKLREAGVQTVAALAGTTPDAVIPDLNGDVFLRLRSQAVLQCHKAKTGENKCEIISSPPDKGFARIPMPNDGDLFFDMEGDPLYPDGLEYLIGVYYVKDGENLFNPFWAHDHKEEKKSFERFMGFLANHLAGYPSAHIYHYNHYETTALKRLACRYAVCEEQLDNLLRNRKFIDLYQVVRESICTSEPGYSLKNLEVFYMGERDGEVTTATDSIIVYNKWRETGAGELLQEIADYNRVDCVSTHLLREWLLTLRPEDTPWFKGQPEKSGEENRQRKDWEIEYEKYKARLGVTKDNPPPLNERLSHLLEFHNREAKPQWWSSFERRNKFEDELIDDTECLGGLQQMCAPVPEQRSLIYTYRFPPQDYKLTVGSQPIVVETMESAGTIVDLDDDACIVKIRRGAYRDSLPNNLSIGPPGPISTRDIRSAIYRYADHVLQAPDAPHAATDLLARNAPRIRGKQPDDAVITTGNLQDGALEAIVALDNSCLFIQGPPGAGKTYTSSHIIVDLMKRGKKIGVTSNSHKAIHNLLERVEDIAAEKGVQFCGVKKATDGNDETFFNRQFIHSETKTEDMDPDADLFAGTAWTFANPHFNGHLDYLFIDEAGQVSTANVVAMATATRNIILVGDQMQLGQPIQGVHPGEAGLSVLEFLLEGRSTIPAERGVFLDQTRRMRPSICRFVSDAFYDGRLTARESTAGRSLNLQNVDLPNEGIVVVPADHEGCSQKSVEEGKIIQTTYQALLGQEFTDGDGSTRPITENDMLVISPYNVQVNYLRFILPGNARVGTIDKFQGQEAPIVLISMVTSGAEDLPRHVEFFYSRNRLNVALSRAQCLAVMVVNPKLLEIPCGNIEQMKLVNTFCRLDEYAKSGMNN
ncbi:MAG: TM0106 family RecB-like putative nuclease [Parvularculales bacterium]